RELQLLGIEDPLLTSLGPGSLIERCLRFELDFESKLVGEFHVPRAGVSESRMKYRAHVPLRFNWIGNDDGRSIWEGACTLVPEFADLVFSVGLGDCTLTISPYEGWFEAQTVWIGLSESWNNPVKVRYHPGDPTVKAMLACPDSEPVDINPFQFAAQYSFFHTGEGSPGGFYLAKDFQLQRLPGEYFALKPYERTIPDPEAVWTEETWFYLKHTPDGPTECP